MKKNRILSLIAIVMAAIMMLCMTGCSQMVELLENYAVDDTEYIGADGDIYSLSLFDDLPEDLHPFHDLLLHTYTEDGFTELTYTTKNVALDAASARADRLLDYVLNVYDVYLENLLEEYGEE